jgi:hypothetical protein
LAFADRERQGGLDLEALELMTREAMHGIGARILEGVLSVAEGESADPACSCGGHFVTHKRESKQLRTVLGEIRLRRRIQRCSSCGSWRVPEDQALDVAKTGFSPGLRRMMAKTGAEVCFDRGQEFLFDLSGVRVTAKEVERVSESVGADVLSREEQRIAPALSGSLSSEAQPSTLYITADGTGVPVLRRETHGRRGKAADGIARTREAKLGAVFTQTAVDERGRPVRDPDSTSYTGKIEEVERFGGRLYAEAVRRGLNEAKTVAVLGDGAPWVWNLAELHFPGAVKIVDFYHAAEHLNGIARLLYPEDEARRKAWFGRMRKRLKRGRVLEIIGELGGLKLGSKRKEALAKAVAYFEKNQERMRYDRFRKQGLFIGSGVVEAGCKSLIGQRLKQSGMHWSVRGANAIIALRCCLESGGFEDYWESRRAA